MSLFLQLKFSLFQISLKSPFSRVACISTFIFRHKWILSCFCLRKFVLFFHILSLDLWWNYIWFLLLAKTCWLNLLWFHNFWKIHHFALASRYWIKIIISVFIWAFTDIFLWLRCFFPWILCRGSGFRISLFFRLVFKIFFHSISAENFIFWNLFFRCWIACVWWLKCFFSWPIVDSLLFTCTSFYTYTFTLTGTLFFKCVSIIWFCILISIFACFLLA